MYESCFDSNNIYDHAAAATSSETQTPSPSKEKDEEESQTDQQGSYESNVNVELKQTQVTLLNNYIMKEKVVKEFHELIHFK